MCLTVLDLYNISINGNRVYIDGHSFFYEHSVHAKNTTYIT